MDVTGLLAFAVKHRITEAQLRPGLPPMVLQSGDTEFRPVNVPPLQQADIDRWLEPLLAESAREALRVQDKCEVNQEIARLGTFRWTVTAAKTVITPPPPPPGRPGFFKSLFGG
jgi:Tfp pilus assembly pilus retraction ATPase PilT